MSLTSRSSAKVYLGIASGDTSDDTLLDTLVLVADGLIKGILGGRILEAASYTLKLDGSGRNFLRLPQWPINSITSIKIDPSWQFGDGSLVDAASYDFDAESGIVYFGTGCTFEWGATTVWPEGIRNIQVIGNLGYSSLPKDVVHAANIVVADVFTRAKQLEGGQSQSEMVSEDLGDRVDDYAKELSDWGVPAQAKAILQRYVRK